MAQGDPVHIFPEMTRCPEGYQGTLPFQLLPFRMAHEAGIPIFPIVFVGTDKVWSKENFGIRYREPIYVRTLAEINPAQFANASAKRRSST